MKSREALIAGIIIGLLTAGAGRSVWAKGAGSSSGATLIQDVSARSAGVGEAYGAVSGDVVSMHFNPAGIADIQNGEIETMYQKGLDEDNLMSLLAAKKYSFGTLGVSVLYYDTGKIEMYTQLTGELISEVGQRDVVAGMTYAMPLSEKSQVGVTLKFISSKIFGISASAVAADAGVQYTGLVEDLDV